MSGIIPDRIVQVALPVDNVERAKAFYRDLIGLEHLFDAPPGLSFLRCGETRLMLSRPEGSEKLGAPLLYYGVEDAATAQSALEQAGVEFLEPARCIARVEGRDIWLAVGKDSEGNMFGLMSEQAA